MRNIFIALFAGITACASVQAADSTTYREKVLYSFDQSDGGYPAAGVIDVNGTLYGTTSDGGGAGCGGVGCGTVFSLDPVTGIETMLYQFQGGTDGWDPVAGLIGLNGVLYGTTEYGGQYNLGTAYSIDPVTGVYTLLHSFRGGTDGSGPAGSLVNLNGVLYGTTTAGGSGECMPHGSGCGTVYSLHPSNGTVTVLYVFQGGADGQQPEGSLVNVNGIMYGTTYKGGGSNDNGTVFAFDRSTGVATVLHSFIGGDDGASPVAGLVDANGILYGTALYGGAVKCSCGIVFSVDPDTGAEAVVHFFTGGSDGADPLSGLVDVNGMLYGTTSQGGTGCGGNACGVIFSLDPNTGTETVLYAFSDVPDGKSPGAGLIAVHSKFYGTTLEGGDHGDGAVFVLKQKR